MSILVIVEFVTLFIFLVFVGIQVYSLVSVMELSPAKSSTHYEPKVSLLLAARNEEELIERSLKHIAQLNYPADKLDVWIGNDQSSDRTRELVEGFIVDRPNFQLIDIKQNMGKGRGKANVLAHLAHQATGEILLITDVDVKLPEGWVRTMIAPFEDQSVGIVSGTTMCERTKGFGMMQSIDWLHFMGYIKAFAHRGISCTSVGNNMAVRSEAYSQTGGYEEIDFSITEDYKLFDAVTGSGWDYRNLMGAGCLGKAWPIPTMKEMLHQRKRWLIGARDLPWNWKFMLMLYGMFYPALLFWMVADFQLALWIWGIKFAIQAAFIAWLTKLNDEPHFRLFALIRYELYLFANILLSGIFYLLPIKNTWKGRVYSSKNVG